MLRDAQMQTILLGVALASAACWWLLVSIMPIAGDVICAGGGIGSTIPAWSVDRAVSLLAMWVAMTPAMMLPGATLAIVQASWDHRGDARTYARAGAFTAGYLLFLLIGGLGAALAQWSLESANLLTRGAAFFIPVSSGFLLMAAGLYQLLPFKLAPKLPCVSAGRCIGPRMSLVDGVRHGRACSGCCVGMICLQFAGGVMNVGWMAFLTAWMLAAAILPWKKHVSVMAGVALFVAGGVTIGILP